MSNKKKSTRIINIRTLLFVVLTSFLLLGFVYKYVEYRVLDQISTTYNETYAKEFRYSSDTDTKGDVFFQAADDYAEKLYSEDVELEALSDSYEKLENSLNVVLLEAETYFDILEENKNEWSRTKLLSNFLLGSNREFASSLVELQEEYYDSELKSFERSLVSLHVWQGYLRAWYDNWLLIHYSNLMMPDPENNAYQYFYIIAPLEKYTDSNFKFKKQKEIQSMFPKSYKGLRKLSNYFASYYLAMKDYISDDMDSYNYKLTKLNEDEIDLNFDLSILEKEGEEIDLRERRKIIKDVYSTIELIKKFEMNQQSETIFGNLRDWQEDTVLCQLYSFKISYVNSLIGEYPKDQTIKGLIKTLAKTQPTNSYVDENFDISVMEFVNLKSKFSFWCKDRSNNEKYHFIINK